MVKNATPTSKNLGGRPPEFDRDAVLTAAVFAFWTGGFEATTVRDLEGATGVDRSTLYKSFGGKTGLYRSAAATYVDMAAAQLFSALHHGNDGLADIVEFLDRLQASYRGGAPRGCLIVNDMASVPEHDASLRYRDHLEGGLRAALARAAAAGEIDAAVVEQRSKLLTAAMLGINVAHRNADDDATAHALLDAVRDDVRSWAALPARAAGSAPS